MVWWTSKSVDARKNNSIPAITWFTISDLYGPLEFFSAVTMNAPKHSKALIFWLLLYQDKSNNLV